MKFSEIITEYADIYSIIPCGEPNTHKTKIPSLLSWKKWQSERASTQQLEEWKKTRKNNVWAIVTGKISNIFVIDCDTHEAVTKFSTIFAVEPNVKTQKGAHFYFRYPNDINKIKSVSKGIKSFPDMDVKADGGYVCFYNGNYEINNLVPHEIKPTLLTLLRENNFFDENNTKKIDVTNMNIPNSFADVRISDIIDITDFVDVGNGERKGAHPYHGSENGNNFTVNEAKGLWHCYRCNSGGDTALLIAMEAGIITCQEASSRALQGKKFIDTLEHARKKGYIQDPQKQKSLEELKKEKIKIEKEIQDIQQYGNIIDSLEKLCDFRKVEKRAFFEETHFKIFYDFGIIECTNIDLVSRREMEKKFSNAGQVLGVWKGITNDYIQFVSKVFKIAINIVVDDTSTKRENAIEIYNALWNLDTTDKKKELSSNKNKYVDEKNKTFIVTNWNVKTAAHKVCRDITEHEIRILLNDFFAITKNGKKNTVVIKTNDIHDKKKMSTTRCRVFKKIPEIIYPCGFHK